MIAIPYRKLAPFFLALSIACVAASIVLLIVPGPRISIDFTGGTLMELRLQPDKSKADLSSAIAAFETAVPLGNVAVSATREQTTILRMHDLTNDEHLALLGHIERTLGPVQELQFTTIGPTVGTTLKERALIALGLASLAIVVYVALAFRHVPRRLSPWRFGIIAVVALIHDITITTGVFVILSHLTSFEFDTLFVTALLTILGYSVNDTIVVFDRIRENVVTQQRDEEFADIAERSVQQSFTRSVNTSATTLILLAALFLLGSESVRWFVLALIVGITLGTYSSIFLATPLLVYWKKRV